MVEGAWGKGGDVECQRGQAREKQKTVEGAPSYLRNGRIVAAVLVCR